MKELLTGVPGIGKSTILREVQRQYNGIVGGVITEEIRDESGKRMGFEVVSFSGERRLLAHKTAIQSSAIVGAYNVDISTIEEFIVPELSRGLRQSGLVMVDEIGRMQALSQKFFTVLDQLFTSHAHLLATIVYDPEPWSLQYKHHSDVTVTEVTEQNRNLLPEQLLRRLEALS